jgi:hypothetical protein
MDHLMPFLRDAAVCLVPRFSEEQVLRIAREVEALSPMPLVSRLTENTVLIHGLPVYAATAHQADSIVWEWLKTRMGDALRQLHDHETAVTAIDVHCPDQLDMRPT